VIMPRARKPNGDLTDMRYAVNRMSESINRMSENHAVYSENLRELKDLNKQQLENMKSCDNKLTSVKSDIKTMVWQNKYVVGALLVIMAGLVGLKLTELL